MSSLFVKTYGCTLNKKDTEDVVGNHAFTTELKDLKKTDFILINTCGVKEQTQRNIIYFLEKLKKEGVKEDKIIIFGCLVDIDKQPLQKIFPKAKYFKVSEKELLKKTIGEGTLENKKKELSKIIVLSNGCLGNCYYCAVKFARGRLKSKSITSIVKEIKKEVEENKNLKEIILTSQDNGCYGLDRGEGIVNLLRDIIKIKGNFKIKIGMANPQHIKPILKELIEIYKHPKIYKFLHIPIQTGNNEVLKEMNRYYTLEDVKKIISAFRKEIPDISIATDIIIGYPTETEKQFKDTLKLIKETNFDFINISRYGERKNIEALKFKDISGNIKKNRSREVTTLFEEGVLKKNTTFLGQIKNITLTEKGKNNTLVGKTEEYRSVVVLKGGKLGEELCVKIIKTDKYHLVGEPCFNKKTTKLFKKE